MGLDPIRGSQITGILCDPILQESLSYPIPLKLTPLSPESLRDFHIDQNQPPHQ